MAHSERSQHLLLEPVHIFLQLIYIFYYIPLADYETSSAENDRIFLDTGEEYKQWKFALVGMCIREKVPIGYLDGTITEDDPDYDPNHDSFIFGTIATSIRGQAMSIVEDCALGKGLQALRLLAQAYEKVGRVQLLIAYKRLFELSIATDKSIKVALKDFLVDLQKTIGTIRKNGSKFDDDNLITSVILNAI